jgi:hypothetical protein
MVAKLVVIIPLITSLLITEKLVLELIYVVAAVFNVAFWAKISVLAVNNTEDTELIVGATTVGVGKLTALTILTIEAIFVEILTDAAEPPVIVSFVYCLKLV